MNIKQFEKQIKKDIEGIFTKILKENNYSLPISSKSRNGAEISDYLEDNFVNYIIKNQHKRIFEPKGAEKGNTKSPYDFCFIYKEKKCNYEDIIWCDIKATKITSRDSNPDLGTPTKLIDFIKDGHFYILFVFFNYKSTTNNKTQFCKVDRNKYVKCQFLKDINKSVRINPKPQFQVNIHEKENYRTLESFIDLFENKYNESINRILLKQKKKKKELPKDFRILRENIKKYLKKFKFS